MNLPAEHVQKAHDQSFKGIEVNADARTQRSCSGRPSCRGAGGGKTATRGRDPRDEMTDVKPSESPRRPGLVEHAQKRHARSGTRHRHAGQSRRRTGHASRRANELCAEYWGLPIQRRAPELARDNPKVIGRADHAYANGHR